MRFSINFVTLDILSNWISDRNIKLLILCKKKWWKKLLNLPSVMTNQHLWITQSSKTSSIIPSNLIINCRDYLSVAVKPPPLLDFKKIWVQRRQQNQIEVCCSPAWRTSEQWHRLDWHPRELWAIENGWMTTNSQKIWEFTKPLQMFLTTISTCKLTPLPWQRGSQSTRGRAFWLLAAARAHY